MNDSRIRGYGSLRYRSESLVDSEPYLGLVFSGLQTINGRNPGLFLYPVVFGVIKSSGFMITKYIEVGILQGLKTGFRVPNQATKTMVVSAVLLQLQVHSTVHYGLGCFSPFYYYLFKFCFFTPALHAQIQFLIVLNDL